MAVSEDSSRSARTRPGPPRSCSKARAQPRACVRPPAGPAAAVRPRPCPARRAGCRGSRCKRCGPWGTSRSGAEKSSSRSRPQRVRPLRPAQGRRTRRPCPSPCAGRHGCCGRAPGGRSRRATPPRTTSPPAGQPGRRGRPGWPAPVSWCSFSSQMACGPEPCVGGAAPGAGARSSRKMSSPPPRPMRMSPMLPKPTPRR